MNRFFKMLRAVWLLCTLSLVAASLTSPLIQGRLNNGLKIAIQEQPGSQTVLVMLVYPFGAYDEVVGKTGLAHATEHMMFTGTRKYPEKAMNQMLQSLGAEYNAQTQPYQTVYYTHARAQDLEDILRLEADRMHNLVFPEKAVARELQVVREERRLRVLDNPFALLYERVIQELFKDSGFGHPVSGWMDDLKGLTLQDVKNWYHDAYAPNHAILIVVGDVRANHVLEKAKTIFSPVLPRVLAQHPKPHPVSADTNSRQTLQLYRPTQTPLLIMAYRVPSRMTAKKAEYSDRLGFLAALLDGGYGARLPKHLVRERGLATHIACTYNPYARDDALFLIQAVPAPKVSLPELQQAIEQEIATLSQRPLQASEINAVQTRMRADLAYTQDDKLSLALEWGQYYALGLDGSERERALQAVRDIQTQDLQDTAKTWLAPHRLITGYLHPPSEKQPKDSSPKRSASQTAPRKSSNQ